ncbi:MAG: polysaccharide biosynthesis tyrosine autokinase [Nocardioides sp.]
MTFLDFVRLTRANLLLILGAVTLGVLAMFGYTLQQPVLYTATSTGYLMVGVATTSGEAMSNLSLAREKAATYAPLITDREVAAHVIEQLSLDESPVSVAGRFSAAVGPGGTTIYVSAVDPKPQLARDLANAGVVGLGQKITDFENAGRLEGQPISHLIRLEPAEEALLPGAPSSPDWQRNLMIGGAAGLLLGFLLALARRSLDRKVRSVSDVEEAVGSVVGIIPKAEPLGRSNRGVSGDLGIASEAFRQLRTNLRFLDVDSPPRSIVITSANAGEGKSTVSANLARVKAAAGQPTILIDADLRRPSLASTYDLDSSVGLTQILAGDLSPREALQETPYPNLRVITAGRIPPNPSELLGSQRMATLVAELSRDHLVILDAPPLLPVTDAGLLTATCDGALLVVVTGNTFREQVTLCRKILDQVGGRLLGGVINMAPNRAMGSVVYGYGYGSYKQEYYTREGYRRRSRRRPSASRREAARR